MIIPMIKYDFLLHRGDLDAFLARLQELGVVDIESHGVVVDDATNALAHEAKRYEVAARELSAIKQAEGAVPYAGTVEQLVPAYESLKEERARLNAAIVKTEREIDEAAAWGEFRPDDLERLRQLRLLPHFYVVAERKFDEEWCRRYCIQEISRNKGKVYFVALQEADSEWDFELAEARPPEKPHSLLMDELRGLNASLRQCLDQLAGMAGAVGRLREARQALLDRIDYNTAALSAKGDAEGVLRCLSAWVPEPKNEAVVQLLEGLTVYYEAEHKPVPVEGSPSPPVLLKNNRFVRLFEPITRLYSLPSYNEFDPTPLFAPFFMLFFGFCLGDGGYGILIFIVVTVLKFRTKDPDTRPLLTLGQWLSASTVLFGLITGTFFGVNFADHNYARMVEEHFNLPENFGMLILSMLLGAVQIIFGMCVNASNTVIQHGWKYALDKVAWIVIVVLGAVHFALKDSLPPAGSYLLYGALGLAGLVVFFYNSPGKNVFVNMGTGVWNSYNTASGLLGDLLSYIRLFALGMTGGILGGVFNKLAVEMSGDTPVVSWIVMLLILLVGHGLNIALNSLGAFVHPLRLTFVEYYKNSGFAGGGRAYRPLRRGSGA